MLAVVFGVIEPHNLWTFSLVHVFRIVIVLVVELFNDLIVVVTLRLDHLV